MEATGSSRSICRVLISTGSRNWLVWAIGICLGFSAEIDWRLRGAVDQFSSVLISTGSRNWLINCMWTINWVSGTFSASCAEKTGCSPVWWTSIKLIVSSSWTFFLSSWFVLALHIELNWKIDLILGNLDKTGLSPLLYIDVCNVTWIVCWFWLFYCSCSWNLD